MTRYGAGGECHRQDKEEDHVLISTLAALVLLMVLVIIL